MLDLADVGDKIPFAVASLKDNVGVLGVANSRGVYRLNIFFCIFLMLTKVAAISHLKIFFVLTKLRIDFDMLKLH